MLLRAGLLEEDGRDSSLVAPLLRSVSGEVARFVASSGFARMPTKQEMRMLGARCRTCSSSSAALSI